MTAGDWSELLKRDRNKMDVASAAAPLYLLNVPAYRRYLATKTATSLQFCLTNTTFTSAPGLCEQQFCFVKVEKLWFSVIIKTSITVSINIINLSKTVLRMDNVRFAIR